MVLPVPGGVKSNVDVSVLAFEFRRLPWQSLEQFFWGSCDFSAAV